MRKTLLSSWKIKFFALFVLLTGTGFGGVTLLAQHHHGEGDHEHTATHEDGHGDHGHHAAAEYAIPDPEISEVIIHHVMDSHDWHLFDLPAGDGVNWNPIELPLPWILYNTKTGLQFFGSTHSLWENPNYILDEHHHAKYVASKKLVPVERYNQEFIEGEVLANPEKYAIEGHGGTHYKVWEYTADEEAAVYDFSITKTVLQMLLVAILLMFIFTAAAKGYRRREGKAPKGIQSFVEPLILFVRNDIAKPYLHHKADKFLPYLLTLFFFIWMSNILGLTPFGFNITGNTAITVALALLTFILILANSTKDFWIHIFWFPGMPVPLRPLMMVVELMGLITKPVALAIRLFANISAGHFMVLSLVCLIFILGDNGQSALGSGVSPFLSVPFALFILAVEVIVAAVQAFVFSLLTAVFIGQAMESHDDH